jgi:hypothetical protein
VASNKRAYVTAIPLVLVNVVAFSGQYAYIKDHVTWLPIGQVVFAVALESVALFLAYMAHQALMSEDSAYGLRISSYAFGAVIGLMNYSHYAGPGMQPTFEAVATGLMSVASPWLWGIYSRRQSRDQLKAKGLIEPRAVRLGQLRWLLHGIRSWRVFRSAVWAGVNRPDEAIASFDLDQPVSLPESHVNELPGPELMSIHDSPLAMAESKADAVRVAAAELGESVTAAVLADWLNARGWDVTPKYVRTAISRDRRRMTASGAYVDQG